MDAIDYTIIIPHKDSLDSLTRLLHSIPLSNRIEIIIVDNSNDQLSRNQITTDRNYSLFYSKPENFAGGARNVGMDNAHGKWLIFADADDYFTEEAFDVFSSYVDSEYDLIYFKVDSVYDDNTSMKSDRHIMYNSIVESYLEGKSSMLETRLSYLVPWGKMIKRELVSDRKIRFDEVIAANDVMFSTLVGYYSEGFTVDRHEVYVVTTRKGSLANRLDLQVTKSRYDVALRRNKFVKEHGLRGMQGSVMVYLYRAFNLGFVIFLSFIIEAIEYRQNIFIGCGNWYKTYRMLLKNNIKNKKYITR